MSRARANWHLADLTLPEGDPMQEISQLKSKATVIDLERGRAEIFEELKVTLRREGEYAAAGVTCSLKAVQGGEYNACDGCRFFTDDTDDARAFLCVLGRCQNRLVDELHAITAAERLDDALMAAYENDEAACTELAASLT